MKCPSLPLGAIVGLFVMFFSVNHVKGTLVVLPSSPGWTAGAPAAGQTVTQTFAGTPNVTISINNNGTAASGAIWSAGYPAINSTKTTGGYTGQNALQLWSTSTASTSAFVRTTVAFASPVNNVSFQLWDVDKSAGQFVDTISSIKALSDTGTVQAASSVTGAVAGYTTITGSGLGIVVNGAAAATNTTNQGTVNVSFTGWITQFSFDWSNSDAGLGAQAIGLGQIDFSVVPEASALWPVLALLAAMVGAQQWRTGTPSPSAPPDSASTLPGCGSSFPICTWECACLRS